MYFTAPYSQSGKVTSFVCVWDLLRRTLETHFQMRRGRRVGRRAGRCVERLIGRPVRQSGDESGVASATSRGTIFG